MSKKVMEDNRNGKRAKIKKGYSLRLRLLLSIVGISMLFWLITLAIMLYVVWDETSEMFDETLVKTGKMLIHAASQNSFDFSGVMKKSRDNPDPDDIHYQIIYQGEVISHSKKAPSTPFVVDKGERKRFENRIINGEKWRIYINGAKNVPMEVQVAQGLEMRLEIFEDFAEDLLIPGLIMLILLILFSSLIIYYLLNPLNLLEKQLKERSPKELTPLSIHANAHELQAIEYSLNDLFARLAQTIENERRFTADAAHELRTPLAAISMQIQLLKRQHPTFADALEKLRIDIDRSTNLVAHLLLLARLDPMEHIEESELTLEWIDPNLLFDTIKKRNQREADREEIILIVDEGDSVLAPLYGNRELIEVMIQNLVRNAILYSPKGARVTLTAEQRDLSPSSTVSNENRDESQSSEQVRQATTLIVADNGPGVSDEELGNLSKRFYRILGTEQSGSGLGLSIVKRIVDLHHATWMMDSGSQYEGMRHRITFYSDKMAHSSNDHSH